MNDVLLVNAAFGLFCKVGRGLPSQIPAINRLVTRLAGSRVCVDRSDRVFATPRLVRFTEMEYALPRASIAEAVRRVLAMVERERLPVPFPIEVRSVAADDAFLSTAAGRESGFVAVHMFEGMAFETYFRAVEAIMEELDGRPHWGKRHFQTAATLRPRYPDWDRFQAIRVRLDPTGVFATRGFIACSGRWVQPRRSAWRERGRAATAGERGDAASGTRHGQSCAAICRG